MSPIALITGLVVVTAAFAGLAVYQRRRYRAFIRAAAQIGLRCRFLLNSKAEFGRSHAANPIYHPTAEGDYRGRPVIVSPSTPGRSKRSRVELRARLQAAELRRIIASKRSAEGASEIGMAAATLAQYASQGEVRDTVGDEALDARFSILGVQDERVRRALVSPDVVTELVALADAYPSVSLINGWLAIEDGAADYGSLGAHLDRVTLAASRVESAFAASA